jgi:hypothetical protein
MPVQLEVAVLAAAGAAPACRQQAGIFFEGELALAKLLWIESS